MNTSKDIYWVTPKQLAELMNIDKATIYRRMKSKDSYKKIESRINIFGKFKEVKVPQNYVEEYKSKYNLS